MSKRAQHAICSFYRKGVSDVGPLVEGPGDVYICGECVDLCKSIIRQERIRRQPNKEELDSIGAASVLDRLARCSEHTKAILLEAGLRRAEGRSKILLIGPESSAVYHARALAVALGAPFAVGTAIDLTKTGPDNLMLRLIAQGEFDAEAAQKGVVAFRGMDQPAAQEIVAKFCADPKFGPLAIDLSRVAFVSCGRFDGLNVGDQIVTSSQLIQAGAHAEWANRLLSMGRVDPLAEDTLIDLIADYMTLPNSVN